jgi:uncharacterized protein YecA (UPF0149 family)
MSLYKDWTNAVVEVVSTLGQDAFWNEYASVEKQVYSKVLNKKEVISGKLLDLAKEYNVSPVSFTGFLDSINSSLNNPLNLDELTEESEIVLDIDYEKLYATMVESGTDFLYELPAWEDLLSAETRDAIRSSHKVTVIKGKKVGRNEACPCGSGLKYKNCCGKNN